MEVMVTTFNGNLEPRKDCVFIRGKYYHKEKDCVLYNGIYYSPNSRYLVYDHETHQKVLSFLRSLQFGVVDMNEDGEIVTGYYSQNLAKNGAVYIPSSLSKEGKKILLEKIASANEEVRESNYMYLDNPTRVYDSPASDDVDFEEEVREEPRASDSRRSSGRRSPGNSISPFISSGNVVACMDVHKLRKSGWLQSKNSDVMCIKKDIAEYDKSHSIKFDTVSAHNPYNFNLAYNSEVMMDIFQDIYSKNNVQGETNRLESYLNGKTFGIEYESWNGRIPTVDAINNGLIPLRDGSLRHDGICGYEYASVVMAGAKGIDMIKRQCELLKEYATFNEKCSMHIHIGNIDRTSENLVRLYKAFHSIQPSIYNLFPSCLMDTSTYKQKAYCSPLPSLSSMDADHVVNFLSDGVERFREFGRPHPKDSSNQHKWNINSRYSICNLNNYYYTGRGTVELRISTPTFNHNKVAALLVIMSLVIDEAIQNNKYYTDVQTLLKANLLDQHKDWFNKYVDTRVKVLSGYDMIDGYGVKYYENMENDNETGNSGDLY